MILPPVLSVRSAKVKTVCVKAAETVCDADVNVHAAIVQCHFSNAWFPPTQFPKLTEDGNVLV